MRRAPASSNCNIEAFVSPFSQQVHDDLPHCKRGRPPEASRCTPLPRRRAWLPLPSSNGLSHSRQRVWMTDELVITGGRDTAGVAGPD
jgi:hypothetical protein